MLTLNKIAKTIAGPNDATHIGEDKLEELQDINWGRLKSQEQAHLLRAASYIRELINGSAFVVANARGDRFRCMGEFADGSGDFVDWTDDPDKALHFARRVDADAFARDDEDAWTIQTVAAIKAGKTKPAGEPTAAVPASGTGERTSDPAGSPQTARCLPVDTATTEDVLRIFRQFVCLNATQWAMGAGDHHHPMWGWLSERIEDEENKTGPDWAFIQPKNRKRHSVLSEEYLDLMNSREAEERGG